MKITDKKSAWIGIIVGLVLISAYKFYKFGIVQIVHKDFFQNEYLLQQHTYTWYRIFATIIGSLYVWKYYLNPKKELVFKQSFWIFNFIIILICYFTFKTFMYGFRGFSPYFFDEAWFNLFTGTFEEVVFRGMILIGLIKLLSSKLWAVLISSVLFSIWHYDVISHPIKYIDIFIMGVLFAYSFLWGASLISLSLFHAFWDQIHFGFVWKLPAGEDLFEFVLLQILILGNLLYLKIRFESRLY